MNHTNTTITEEGYSYYFPLFIFFLFMFLIMLRDEWRINFVKKRKKVLEESTKSLKLSKTNKITILEFGDTSDPQAEIERVAFRSEKEALAHEQTEWLL